MPWLTPDSIPEADDCRPLSIPADSVWLALVSGALTELTLKYNWQKFGSLTVDETVAKMQQIIDGYYNDPCSGCALPGGGKIIRIAPDGTLQELGSDGSWTDATGDYYIPPPSAREGDDPRCLAAANAVNVLKHLYDDLAMSWSSHLSEAEAATSFTLAAIGLIGFEFAPITASIVAFFGAVFTALYEALSYLGTDLWDDNVSKQIECFLLECAVNDVGVVTFDWQCFLGRLNSLTDDFLLSETQLRLYIQITYILYFIGGVAGLNLAGRTTAIETATCECSFWCYNWPFELSTNTWEAASDLAVWVSGSGWESVAVGSFAELHIQASFTPATVEGLRFDWTAGDNADGGTRSLICRNAGVDVINVAIGSGSGAASFAIDVNAVIDYILIRIDNGGSTALNTVSNFEFWGSGTNPIGDDNCVPP